MFDRIIGRYLVSKGLVTREALKEVYAAEESSRARLGVIGVSERMLTIPQAEEINALQAVEDKYFGDLAVERGYLSPLQVTRLLALQRNPFLVFSQALVDRGVMTIEALTAQVAAYQQEHHLTSSDMAALGSDEVDRIVPIFLNTEDQDLKDLFVLSIKNIYRLADHHVCIGEAYHTTNIKSETVSYQWIHGDVDAAVAILGHYEDVRRLAVAYTNELFIETREDALDAVCELINCVNGLFASDRSRQNIHVDVEPPRYTTTFSDISASDLTIMPVYLSDAEFKLIVTKDAVARLR
ncbi:MAG: hypothetical protein IJT34_06435 [Butyrivibrio sp.]|nr:hypothetical protein [Butyrivibrio sp.]